MAQHALCQYRAWHSIRYPVPSTAQHTLSQYWVPNRLCYLSTGQSAAYPIAVHKPDARRSPTLPHLEQHTLRQDRTWRRARVGA
eukprot:3941340-Rhodomonas_salina.1